MLRKTMILKVLDNKSKALIAIAFAGWLTLLACSINVKDHDANGNSKVDINTPMGQIHVNEDADVRDTDLPVYPGATLKPKSGNDGDEKSANVNISSMGYGLRVVALEYESHDSPDKVIAFYQDKMKKFGSVLQCHTNKRDGDAEASYSGKNDLSKPVSCTNSSGHVVELKVGTEGNQHIVSVEPEGKGSDFSLVYVQIHGKQTI